MISVCYLTVKHWNQLTSWPAGGRRVSLPAVGRALYSLSLHKLDRASSTGVVSRILPLLLQAACLADNRALHMSSVLYSTGLGVKKQPSKVCMCCWVSYNKSMMNMPSFFSSLMPLCVEQAWLLALLAAQKDDRLALLHLGHVHHRGLHGFPADPDLAYAYYANIAKQTTLDRQNLTPQQVMYAFVAGCFGRHVLFRMKSNTVLPYVVPKAHHWSRCRFLYYTPIPVTESIHVYMTQ